MSWKCFDCFRNQVEDVHLLDYQHCMLYDVPIEVFAYERTLEELKLDANRIRDLPRPLFHCHGLKVLSLSDNDIQTLPPAVASLINLQKLDLSRNALSSIPDNIKCCKLLHCVDVSINPLEKLPEGFTQLINLEELYLNDTYLDFLPANFGRLTRLKILELRENNLNTLPKSIARLSKLERLDLGQNEFSDMPEAIGSLTNLAELWVDCNRIKNISSLIGNLKKLVHFDASNNNISWISLLIEKCERLVDLTLSCNELHEVPSSIGSLKDLVTLKLDNNQLRTIPSSIGNLSLLQELILSQNNLENLPSTIGLLRRLHILNIDDNFLEDLPSEIGSCSSLTLLSVRNNKLQEVPAELGHLQRIKVINLSDNLLQNLPVSILKLTHLNALWLSNNQSTPLIILQKENDRETGKTVCVNFMLPQTPQDSVTVDQYIEHNEAPVRSRPHIRFAIEAVDAEPHHLLRAPTPYPKELRAMAKHARAIHQGPKRAYKEVSEDAPLLGKMRVPWPNDVKIKEAKVKKPETFSLCEQGKPGLFPALAVSESIQETSFHPAENRPIIREAKYVRQKTSVSQNSGNKFCDEVLQQDHVSVPSCTNQEELRLSIASSLEHPLQPPPYHIAAAYSKQAKWFGHFNLQMRGEDLKDNLCYDLISTNIAESNIKGFDKHSPASVSSEKNESSFHSTLEIIGSDNMVSWSQTNDAVTCEEVIASEEIKGLHEDDITTVCEEKFQCVTDTLLGEYAKRVCVKSDSSISLQFEDNGPNYRNKHLVTGLHTPTISSKLFSGNSQSLQHNTFKSTESVGRKLESLTVTPHSTSTKYLLNNVDEDLKVMHPVSSLDEEVIHSDSFDRVMNETVPYVKDTLTFSLENCTGGIITKSLSSCGTSPEAGTKIYSTYISERPSDNSIHFVDQSQIASDFGNNLNSPLQNETSFKVPSLLPVHNSKYCESSNCKFCNGQFLDSNPKDLVSNEACGYESNMQVTCSDDVLSYYATVDSDNKTELSYSVKSSAMQNFEPSYQQDSAMKAITPALKSTKVSASAIGCKGNSKFWRFGLHRNPTVLPILIHKTEELGFDISGNVDMSLLPENQKGIVVTNIDPRGPASSLLLPGDKILEVDGNDFSKINYDEAVKILQNTGSVVHMMVSRQQQIVASH